MIMVWLHSLSFFYTTQRQIVNEAEIKYIHLFKILIFFILSLSLSHTPLCYFMKANWYFTNDVSYYKSKCQRNHISSASRKKSSYMLCGTHRTHTTLRSQKKSRQILNYPNQPGWGRVVQQKKTVAEWNFIFIIMLAFIKQAFCFPYNYRSEKVLSIARSFALVLVLPLLLLM